MAHKIQVFSRHRSHDVLRRNLPELDYRVRLRFGSTTERMSDSNYVIINSPESVRNAMDKLKTKRCFMAAGIITADWCSYDSISEINNILDFPIVAKNRHGSRGTGVYLINDYEKFETWTEGRDLNKYIFEKFMNYSREYRLHVSNNGCFYALRKMLKSEAPLSTRWCRNNSNSVWINEENAKFDKPTNWDLIVKEGVRALESVKLNIGALDIKVQSAKKSDGTIRRSPKFFIIEINSAPSLGDQTHLKYLEEIPKLAETIKNRTI